MVLKNIENTKTAKTGDSASFNVLRKKLASCIFNEEYVQNWYSSKTIAKHMTQSLLCCKHMTQSLLCCMVEPDYQFASKTILLQIVLYAVFCT